MMDFLQQLVYWHWFILGMILLGLETLGVGGFLIGIGVAAIGQGIISLIAPSLSWQVQLVLFGVMALVFSFVYWKFFRKVNEKTDRPAINDRARQMIGKTATVVAPNKIQIGDVMWDYECDDKPAIGDTVTVTEANGMTLVVKT